MKALKAGTNVSISDDAQIVTVSAPNVYTKTETETALGFKAIKADVYTKRETDSKLTDKTYAADVYTKSQAYSQTQANDLLALRAPAYDRYTKADVYTKTEILASLALKASILSPTFSGVVTAANMVVTQDIALTRNIVTNGAGKTITCTNLTAEGNLAVSDTSNFYAPLDFTSTLTCGDVKSSGTQGVKILKSDRGTAVKSPTLVPASFTQT